MYGEEADYTIKLYEYVGMVEDVDLYNTVSAEILDNIVKQANIFRTKHHPYMLQLLEQSVVTMMPFADKYRRTSPPELFVYGFGIKGIHYFRRIE